MLRCVILPSSIVTDTAGLPREAHAALQRERGARGRQRRIHELGNGPVLGPRGTTSTWPAQRVEPGCITCDLESMNAATGSERLLSCSTRVFPLAPVNREACFWWMVPVPNAARFHRLRHGGTLLPVQFGVITGPGEGRLPAEQQTRSVGETHDRSTRTGRAMKLFQMRMPCGGQSEN
jgi:hypothetical protein